MTGPLSKTLSRALSGPLNPAAAFPSAITVSGTLTSDGSTPVVFPTLVYAGLYFDYHSWTNDGSPAGGATHKLYRFEGNWVLSAGSTQWISDSGNAATPDQATGWTASFPSTGTPVLTAV